MQLSSSVLLLLAATSQICAALPAALPTTTPHPAPENLPPPRKGPIPQTTRVVEGQALESKHPLPKPSPTGPAVAEGSEASGCLPLPWICLSGTTVGQREETIHELEEMGSPTDLGAIYGQEG
ncbi:hypothetical protein LTR37_010637 [Vermiconidia calcicola]|uniref:Uncharacterized protein n=1 Tax=Vermiconidia calcicola TaxID=1690605 RepID=A0ACC3N749_9PEZI|nr:hypothetical protein LTR37_010637 [Vermiconidia calcicola]